MKQSYNTMHKGRYFSATSLLLFMLVMPPVATQPADNATFFEDVKRSLQEEFSPALQSLDEARLSLTEARSDLDLAASQTPWLVEDPPGSGNMTFSLDGLARFKVKVMHMVEQKAEFLSQRARLQRDMTQALYNLSLPYYQTLGNRVSDGHAETGPADMEDFLSILKQILRQDEDTGEIDMSKEVTRETTRSVPTSFHEVDNESFSESHPALHIDVSVNDVPPATTTSIQSTTPRDAKSSSKPKTHASSSENIPANREEILAELKQRLLEEFGPALSSLNDSRRALLQALEDRNSLTSQEAWIEDSPPNRGKSLFNFAGLAGLKSNIKQLVEQKLDYLAQKAQLRQDMTSALYNMSLPYFDALQDGGKDTAGSEENANLLRLIRRIFGLYGRGHGSSDVDDSSDVNGGDSDVNDDGEDLDNDSIIDTLLAPSQHEETQEVTATTVTPPAADLDTRHQQSHDARSRWNPRAAGSEREGTWPHAAAAWDWKRWRDARGERHGYNSRQRKRGRDEEGRRRKWRQLAHDKAARSRINQPEGHETALADIRERLLEDIKVQLFKQFAPAINNLNESRNGFIRLKRDMALTAAKRPWEQHSPEGGVTFNPDALRAFKSKIRDMVRQKKEYVAEKAKLRKDMTLALRDLLLSHLDQIDAQSSDGDTASVSKTVKPEPANPEQTDASSLEESPSEPEPKPINTAAAEIVKPVLQEILQLQDAADGGVASDVLDGLPFAESLMLAVAPPGGESVAGAGSGNAGEVIAVVVLGILAVVAAAVAVAGTVFWRSGRRTLYARVP